MEKTIIKRKVRISKENVQWKVYQLLGDFAGHLDRLPDAREVRNNPQRSAPQEIAEMVF
jgi:hypothetical protein